MDSGICNNQTIKILANSYYEERFYYQIHIKLFCCIQLQYFQNKGLSLFLTLVFPKIGTAPRSQGQLERMCFQCPMHELKIRL